MDEKPDGPEEKDERLAIPLDPEEALRALLQVDPGAPSAESRRREHPNAETAS
jgi:hypothetical protein